MASGARRLSGASARAGRVDDAMPPSITTWATWTLWGAPIAGSTASNRDATDSGRPASQVKARAPVSAQSGASYSVVRAASATASPWWANRRASEALRPGPAPTIKALRNGAGVSGVILWSP